MSWLDGDSMRNKTERWFDENTGEWGDYVPRMSDGSVSVPATGGDRGYNEKHYWDREDWVEYWEGKDHIFRPSAAHETGLLVALALAFVTALVAVTR